MDFKKRTGPLLFQLQRFTLVADIISSSEIILLNLLEPETPVVVPAKLTSMMQCAELSCMRDAMSVSHCNRCTRAASFVAQIVPQLSHHQHCCLLGCTHCRMAAASLTQHIACYLQTPKASEAGQLTWDGPSHTDDSQHGQNSAKSTYYEAELERLRNWHPQQSRFKKECVRKSSSGGGAPPHSFLHHDISPGRFSPEH